MSADDVVFISAIINLKLILLNMYKEKSVDDEQEEGTECPKIEIRYEAIIEEIQQMV